MKIGFVVGFSILCGLPGVPVSHAASAPTAWTSQDPVEAALAPMRAAIAAERQSQAEQPAGTDAERLVHLGRLDQVARRALRDVALSDLDPGVAGVVRGRALGIVHEIDLETRAGLLALAPSDRWFSRAEYGDEASQAAFLIVQHGDEPLFRRFLPLLEPLVGTGQIEDGQYALMYDRVAVSDGRPQRYGSQFVCVGTRSELAPLEDPDTVDARRAAMGMISMEANRARFAGGDPCRFNGGGTAIPSS